MRRSVHQCEKSGLTPHSLLNEIDKLAEPGDADEIAVAEAEIQAILDPERHFDIAETVIERFLEGGLIGDVRERPYKGQELLADLGAGHHAALKLERR